MSEEPTEVTAAEPIMVAQFEGEYVTEMEAKLPAISLSMDEGYARGTHLKLEVEVRVRNVRYEEIPRGEHKGDLSRVHVLALEQVRLVGAFSAEQLDQGVGGSASAASVAAEDAVEAAEALQEELEGSGRESGPTDFAEAVHGDLSESAFDPDDLRNEVGF